tara:strand:- start:262 stop:468 length:207 start_codon:yes stop_codon:yes gene_type:complete
MEKDRKELIENLAKKAINSFEKLPNEIDRNCWFVVHEYIHGVMPSEYDIREVDEELYLAVLKRVNELN